MQAQATALETTEKLIPFSFEKRIRGKIRINTANLEGYQFKIAETKEEFEGACRLVHDQYVQKGYMERRKSGMRLSLNHALPETTTFIGKQNDSVVYTLTLFQDSPLGLPMDSIYKKELDGLRARGRKIAEVGALAAHPTIQYEDQTVLMHGNKIMHTYGREYLGIDDLVIAINPKHRWFYEYVLLFEKIGDLIQYDYVKKAPAVAYRIDLKKARKKLFDVYGDSPPDKNLHDFFFKQQNSCIELPWIKRPMCFWDKEKLSYFFEEKTTLLYKANRKEREYIRNQYRFKSGIKSDIQGSITRRRPSVSCPPPVPEFFCPMLARVQIASAQASDVA